MDDDVVVKLRQLANELYLLSVIHENDDPQDHVGDILLDANDAMLDAADVIEERGL